MDATNFTLVEVASQTISSSMVDVGDSFTFEVVVDLPGIIVANKSDMVIEIFGLDADSGKIYFFIKYLLIILVFL